MSARPLLAACVVCLITLVCAPRGAAAEQPTADRSAQLAAAVDHMAAEALTDRGAQVAGVRIVYGPYYTRVAYRPFIGGYYGYGYGYPYYGYPYYSYPLAYPYYSYRTYYTPYVYSPYTYSAFYRPAVYAPVIAPAPVYVAPPLLVGYGGCYYW